MIILKCVQVLNDGYIKRYVSVFDDQKSADEYKQNFLKQRRFCRDLAVEQVDSLSKVSLEDCKNNSIETIAKLLKVYNITNCNDYLRRDEVIALINKVIKEKEDSDVGE